MKQHKIFPTEWLKLHPYRQTGEADLAYTKVANEIYDALKIEQLEEVFGSDEHIRTFACYLTAYLEDQASELGIWQAFTRECRKLYGKPLPFFEIVEEDYYDDEVNLVDVQFLLWHYLQAGQREVFIDPLNPLIAELADYLYKLVDDNYQTVPDNEKQQEYLSPEKETVDYIDYLDMLAWFHYDSYLNLSNQRELSESLQATFERTKYDNPEAVAFAIQTELCYTSRHNLLSVPSPEWLSKIIDKQPLYADVKRKEFAWYLYQKEDERFIYLSPLAEETGELLAVEKRSIRKKPANPGVSCLGCALVYYNQAWWQSGLSIEKERDKLTEQDTARFDKTKEKANAAAVYESFMKASGGEMLMFFESMKDVMNFCRKKMKYAEAENLKLPVGTSDRVLLTATRERGLQVILHGLECIKHPKNPFYNEEKAKSGAIAFYLIPAICPFEVTHYLMENNLLPDASINNQDEKAYAHSILHDNRDFICRYFLNKCAERDL